MSRTGTTVDRELPTPEARDLLDLTVMEAALRLPDASLARAITAERRALKPDSLHARSMFDRARALRDSATD